jgi:Mrp family chromosome partitioning ATPase
VLVVSNQETPKYVVREACSRLNYARAKILGVMLNRVNLRSGDYAYYYRPYYS